MTKQELADWIKKHGLSHQEAAALLGLTRRSLRGNLYGERPVGSQTAIIAGLLDEAVKRENGASDGKYPLNNSTAARD